MSKIEPKKVLPTLVQMEKRFSIFIEEPLKTKILACNKFCVKEEWSGTLFYTTEGSIDEGNLVITAKDMFLQDKGNGVYTEFSQSPLMAKYALENGLFGHKRGLIHSHHNMTAYFSGTDSSTLQELGEIQPNFVSLIVNNDGNYCAAVTRRIVAKSVVTYSFQGFGDELLPIEGYVPQTKEEMVIQQFNLDFLQYEEDFDIENSMLARFQEIADEKAAIAAKITAKAKSMTSSVVNTGNTGRMYSGNEYYNRRNPSVGYKEDKSAMVSPWLRILEKDAESVAAIIVAMTCANDSIIDNHIDTGSNDLYNQVISSGETTIQFVSVRGLFDSLITNIEALYEDDSVSEIIMECINTLEDLSNLSPCPFFNEFLTYVNELYFKPLN